MAGSGGQGELEPELIRVGQSLASLPSDINDIVDLLDVRSLILSFCFFVVLIGGAFFRCAV